MDEFIEENKNITNIVDLTFEYNEMEINALKKNGAYEVRF